MLSHNVSASLMRCVSLSSRMVDSEQGNALMPKSSSNGTKQGHKRFVFKDVSLISYLKASVSNYLGIMWIMAYLAFDPLQKSDAFTDSLAGEFT